MFIWKTINKIIRLIFSYFFNQSSDSLIKEYDMATFTCLRQFKAHDGPVLDLIVVNNKIISCGCDKIIIWDMKKK